MIRQRKNSLLSSLTMQTQWQSACINSQLKLPIAIKNWLLTEDSLTEKLRRHCQSEFRVSVLQQCRAYPWPVEARCLQLKPGKLALIREVVLFDGQQAIVEARSIIPLSSLSGHLHTLSRLGNRPLGGFIFNQPGIFRSRLDLALNMGSGQMARRNCYHIEGANMLVTEVFLPEFIESVSQDH